MNFVKGITRLGFIIAMGFSVAAMALTDSGLVIKNQAGATYLDSASVQRSTASNLVETLVNPVVAFMLINDQAKRGAPGGTVTFHHILTNTGNSADTFQLDINILSSGFDAATIYADANQDGLPDIESLPINSGALIGPLAPGETYEFVIEAEINSSVALNTSPSFTIKATSQKAITGTALVTGAFSELTNTDTVNITDLPIIEITKSLSKNSGPSPSGPYIVTFNYKNVGLSDMDPTNTNGIKLTDVLPKGMRFNGGVTWSISNSIITASGVTSGTTETAGDQDLSFSTCIAPDFGCTANDRVQFIMDGLAQGASAQIRFEVNIEAGLLATTLYNQAIYGYDEDNSGAVDPLEEKTTNTNRVPFLISADYGVIANNGGCNLGTDNNCNGLDDTNYEIVDVAFASQGEKIRFTNYIWNTGNDADIFNITLESSSFPTGTSFFFYKSDGITPLLDTDNDGKPDTGTLPAAGQSCPSYFIFDSTNELCGSKVVIMATLPISALGGPYQVTKRATSSNDISKTNTVIDKLTAVIKNTVDLTNNLRTETATTTENECDELHDECGFGIGAEDDPVSINSALPGETTRFILYVTNTSNIADSYVLQYSDTDFSVGDLPTGWTVNFKNTDNAIITSTPTIAPDNSFSFYADVTVPENSGLGEQSIYFKALSPSTGAFDIKHDAVFVSDGSCLIFEPATRAGSVAAGSTIIYKHKLVNNNLAQFDNVALNISNSVAGFSTVIYADSDNNGVFSLADTAISTIPTIAGKTAYTFFVKVFSPSNALENTVNLTKIGIDLPCGIYEAIDTTTVTNTNMKITKEQTLDAGCDGVSDSGSFVTTNFAVTPGQCVIYRLTTENTGIYPAHNVTIQDATPAYTRFLVVSGIIPSLSKGTLNTVIDGDSGSIIGSVGTVEPAEIETLIFGVRIDN